MAEPPKAACATSWTACAEVPSRLRVSVLRFRGSACGPPSDWRSRPNSTCRRVSQRSCFGARGPSSLALRITLFDRRVSRKLTGQPLGGPASGSASAITMTFAGVVHRHRRGSTASNHLWPSNSSRCGGLNFLRYSISFFSSIILSSRPTVRSWNRSSSAALSAASL